MVSAVGAGVGSWFADTVGVGSVIAIGASLGSRLADTVGVGSSTAFGVGVGFAPTVGVASAVGGDASSIGATASAVAGSHAANSSVATTPSITNLNAPMLSS